MFYIHKVVHQSYESSRLWLPPILLGAVGGECGMAWVLVVEEAGTLV